MHFSPVYLKEMYAALIEPPRTCWAGQTQAPPTGLLIGGQFYRKPKDIANYMQNFFDKKIIKLMSKIKNTGHDPLETLDRAFSRWINGEKVPTFSIKEINVQQTLKLISKLGSSTAYGRDEMDSLTIKTAVDYLAHPITEIINLSIKSGTFIMKWKVSRIIPILKAKELSHRDQLSYRPISLLPVF